MTTTNHRPTAVGGASDDPNQRARIGTNRCMANLSSAVDRYRLQTNESHSDLAHKQRLYAERSDQGHGEILNMLDEMSHQTAEGHELMATKADVEKLAEMIRPLLEDRQKYDTYRVPVDQSNFITDPEEPT